METSEIGQIGFQACLKEEFNARYPNSSGLGAVAEQKEVRLENGAEPSIANAAELIVPATNAQVCFTALMDPTFKESRGI